MKNIIFTCDHCGKEINEMAAFTDMQIDNFIDYVKVDLCNKCFHELNDIVLQYVNKKKENKDT
jgi:hypothetical protein